MRQQRRVDGAAPQRADRGRPRPTSTSTPDVDEVAAAVRLPGVPRSRPTVCSKRSARRPTSTIRSSEGEVLEAEITDVSRRGGERGRSRLARCPALDVVAAWSGEPGRSELIGLAVVTDVERVRSARGSPPTSSARPRRARSALASAPSHVRGHNAKALMRWLLGHGLESIDWAADRHRDRRLPHRPGRRALRAGRPARAVHAVPAAGHRRRPSPGQLDFGDDGDDDRRVAGREALAVAHLSSALQSALDKQGMADLYATIENPLVGVLAEMEHVGIAVDVAELRRLNDRLTSEVERLARRAAATSSADRSTSTRRCSCARSCTPSSSLAPQKKTKTGFSTDAATLREAARRVARVHRPAAAVPRDREAPRHLRRSG